MSDNTYSADILLWSEHQAAMRQLLDVDAIYAKALKQLPETMDGQPLLPVPTQCPVTLDELLGDG